MTDINTLVLLEFLDHPLSSKLASAGKQALVWGAGGGLSYLASKQGAKRGKEEAIKNAAAKLINSKYGKTHNISFARRLRLAPKPRTEKEKEQRRRDLSSLRKSIGAGALAGALGAIV